ncbi:MAG: PIN domain-containing protein [Nitrospirae bacterium]|nr:PIN domain-containing protein [Nitrospirota bacterium]
MKRIFVDTGAWYALVDRNDPDHTQAAKFLKSNTFPLVTTNYVFGETVTLLRMRLGWPIARDFGQRLRESSVANIVTLKDEDEEKAWETFLKYKDKDFSHTDCTSFALMGRLKIDTAFSFDRHFMAMRFNVVPGL